jgi:hypothetical protein
MTIKGFTTPTIRGDHPNLRLSWTGGECKERKMYRFTSPQVSDAFGIHNNTVQNVRRSLMERVYMVEKDGVLQPTPKPISPKHIQQTLSDFKIKFKQVAPHLPPLSAQEFLGRYQGGKRKRYELAMESLLGRGIERGDAFMSTFVKGEKLNLTVKSDPAPRAIQPRTPRFNFALGCYIAHLEKPVYRAISELFGGPTVMKGYNAVDTGRHMKQMWDEFEQPVAIGLDASRFDQHVSKEMLQWEHDIWAMCMSSTNDVKSLRKLLAMQLTNKGFARCDDGVIRYTVEGCRMSGDMNTASGNCIIMCAMIYCLCLKLGIKCRLANNGDDCVLFIHKKDLLLVTRAIPGYFTDLGFTMKVEEPCYDFESIEFCQTKPVWTYDHYRMVRIPQVAMAKDLTANHPINDPLIRSNWLSLMRDAGSSLTAGCPVWGSFYRMFPPNVGKRVHLQNFEDSGMIRHMSKGLQKRMLPITPRARYSFWLAFGITPDEQIVMENSFDAINLGTAIDTGSSMVVVQSLMKRPHGYNTTVSSIHGRSQSDRELERCQTSR